MGYPKTNYLVGSGFGPFALEMTGCLMEYRVVGSCEGVG